ncbi:transferrin-binding protein-like solute binding protein [Roseinatronobacter alkalisoli]|uniref:Transferrin-binding protein-like solute binding protein n=1 Tax=Roseinatronobacter alkalisoli TaxID=3028235 RepID=A0ABT5T616_9RHOB|nr:transferrin-binding protein-like solute binding protein [Roseinatronobacter sp. HJB301]MDD7970555.1 transferrin-binding protein-like solute binding protein [Roseinatronobacter sp. HJB301]
MSRHFFVAALMGSATVLSACGGGSSGGGAPAATRSSTSVLSQGTDAQEGTSRVFATLRESGEVQFQFEDGALQDMVVICVDYSGASCRVVGGPQGTLETATLEGRMAGEYAYAGSLRLDHATDGQITHSYHRLYQSAPASAPTLPAMPQGVQDYRGHFMAGAIVNGEGGIAEGGIALTVNFDSALMSGTLNGTLRDSATDLRAGFNNVTIDQQTGQFAATNTSTFTFDGAVAGGTVQGGFYGPQADEAAGAFEIGLNDANGMSGVFLACQGLQDSCVSHGN